MPKQAVIEPLALVKRITVKCGNKSKRLVLVAPPWPEIGTVLTIEGDEWAVTKIKEDRKAFSVSFRDVRGAE